MTKKPQKSESLSIRLDPKTRFMLEFVSRLRGQTITTVIERAIMDAADRATFPSQTHSHDRSWRDFWHIEESIRALKTYDEPELRPDYEEEKRLEFAKKNWPFFYTDASCTEVRRDYTPILWSKIDEFIAIDDQFRNINHYAAVEAMKGILLNARVEFEEPQAKTKKRAPSPGNGDDIPF